MEVAVRIGSVLIILWLIVGAIAANQRGYFSDNETNCAEAGTIFVTIIAGPLNYLGVNPQIDCPDLPEPSP
jgi:hypothetical protein